MFGVRVFKPVFRSERRLNTTGEPVFADQKKGAAPSAPPPFSAYEEVFARSVQTAFRSEHWPEHPNTEQVFSER